MLETNFYKKDNIRQNSETLIMVEGEDDVSFISSVLNEIGANPQRVGIIQVNGTGNFPSAISGLFKTPSFTQSIIKTLAIVCDADSNVHKITSTISGVFEAAQQPKLALGGFVNNNRGMRFGLFAMPDSTQPGDLEKLCLDTVAGSDTHIAAASFMETALSSAREKGRTLNGSLHKRTAQVLLAGTALEPVRGAGRGFAENYFDRNHAALKPLKDFLRATIGD